MTTANSAACPPTRRKGGQAATMTLRFFERDNIEIPDRRGCNGKVP